LGIGRGEQIVLEGGERPSPILIGDVHAVIDVRGAPARRHRRGTVERVGRQRIEAASTRQSLGGPPAPPAHHEDSKPPAEKGLGRSAAYRTVAENDLQSGPGGLPIPGPDHCTLRSMRPLPWPVWLRSCAAFASSRRNTFPTSERMLPLAISSAICFRSSAGPLPEPRAVMPRSLAFSSDTWPAMVTSVPPFLIRL